MGYQLVASNSNRIGSRAFLLLKGKTTPPFSPNNHFHPNQVPSFSFTKTYSSFIQQQQQKQQQGARNFTAAARSNYESPDLPRLAETARISLTPDEVEEFAPKIQQVVDWFGQLQAVDLQNIEPAIRADTEGSNWRDDLPETFENREPMIAAVPNYEEPYIKVPKVLNKE